MVGCAVVMVMEERRAVRVEVYMAERAMARLVMVRWVTLAEVATARAEVADLVALERVARAMVNMAALAPVVAAAVVAMEKMVAEEERALPQTGGTGYLVVTKARSVATMMMVAMVVETVLKRAMAVVAMLVM